MLLKVLVTQSGSSRSWVNPTFLSCREQRFTQAPLRTSRKPGGPDWEAAGKGALPQVPAPSALVGGGESLHPSRYLVFFHLVSTAYSPMILAHCSASQVSFSTFPKQMLLSKNRRDGVLCHARLHHCPHPGPDDVIPHTQAPRLAAMGQVTALGPTSCGRRKRRNLFD